MRVCEEMLKIVQRNRDLQLDLAGGSRLASRRSWTRAKHARSWSVMPIGALQDKKYRLVVQLPRGWNSQLSQAASLSCQPALFWKTWLFTLCVVLVFASLFPKSLPSNFCCGCDFIWFRLFINSVLSLIVYQVCIFCTLIVWY